MARTFLNDSKYVDRIVPVRPSPFRETLQEEQETKLAATKVAVVRAAGGFFCSVDPVKWDVIEVLLHYSNYLQVRFVSPPDSLAATVHSGTGQELRDIIVAPVRILLLQQAKLDPQVKVKSVLKARIEASCSFEKRSTKKTGGLADETAI